MPKTNVSGIRPWRCGGFVLFIDADVNWFGSARSCLPCQAVLFSLCGLFGVYGRSLARSRGAHDRSGGGSAGNFFRSGIVVVVIVGGGGISADEVVKGGATGRNTMGEGGMVTRMGGFGPLGMAPTSLAIWMLRPYAWHCSCCREGWASLVVTRSVGAIVPRG